MANNLDSNFTRKLARIFLKAFETRRVISKNVNTQLLDGKFDPSTGSNYDFKRPHDYKSVRTSTGDVSGATKSDIISGKATGTVQDYFTVFVDFNEADEAIKLDQLGMPGESDTILGPMATRIVTDLEIDFAKYMMINAGLHAGTYGSSASTWAHVAGWGALMESTGIPKDGMWCAAVNPYTQISLSSNQRSLGAGPDSLISQAHREAIISDNFAGLKVLAATALSTMTTHSVADRAGTIASNPTVTYVAHKDTMVQSIAVTAFGANLQVRAGEVVQITGRNRLNLSTRQPIVTGTGANVLYTGVVTEAVTLDGSGAGTLKVAGPAIYEATGAYNTVDSAPVATDVITLLGSNSTLYQPNLFWHKQAFSIGSVPIKKLYSTDTIATTQDGLQMRISKGVGFLENQNKVRVDFRPAYATLNPFFAGQGWGS